MSFKLHIIIQASKSINSNSTLPYEWEHILN